MNSKAKGELSEAKVLVRCVELGIPVAIPFGNNQRYDFILDINGDLVRAQVKTARWVSGSIAFNVSSINGFTGKRTTYEGGADIFLVYSPDTDSIYRIPVSECGVSAQYLRIDPLPDARSASSVRWAKDYILGSDANGEQAVC